MDVLEKREREWILILLTKKYEFNSMKKNKKNKKDTLPLLLHRDGKKKIWEMFGKRKDTKLIGRGVSMVTGAINKK